MNADGIRDPTAPLPTEKPAYSPDIDYKAMMDKAIAAGGYKIAAVIEQAQNAKIAGMGLDEPQTHLFGTAADRTLLTNDELGAVYHARMDAMAQAGDGPVDWSGAHDVAEDARARHGYSGGADGSKVLPYDPNVDYSAQMAAAIQAKDYKLAAVYELMRNAKIEGEGRTDVAQTHMFGSAEDAAYMTNDELATCYEVRQKAMAAAKDGKPVDWTEAHETVEAIRMRHGYSGGVDGSSDTDRYQEALAVLGRALPGGTGSLQADTGMGYGG